MILEKFLTAQQQATVVDAVRLAEKGTSGEIRIHIDRECKSSPVERAEVVFNRLGMHKTAQRNGVLIYVAVESRKLAIIGDAGINNVVPDNFWDNIKQKMGAAFSQGDFIGGLSGAIKEAGESLKKYFPYQSDDVNEQPDEISFGE